MNFDLIYERVLMRLKEQNEITEEDINGDESSEKEETLEEFSGSGAIAGVATPIGTDPYGNVGSPSKWLKKNRTH